MGEGGPCPRGRPAPGPEAARMASVAIGDVAAESMNVVVGEPGFAAGKGAEGRKLSRASPYLAGCCTAGARRERFFFCYTNT